MLQLDAKSRETKNWLTIAKSDLGAGQMLLSNEEFAAQASFHAQQTAEKALKAFLVWHEKRFSKEHDIRYLGEIVLKIDPSLVVVINDAVDLNPYAVTFRYPGFTSEELPKEDAIKALNIAENLYKEILSRLPKKVHP